MSNKSTASTHQFVICAINIETATNRKFLQAFTNKECEPLRFDSVNDCVLYLAKIGATSAEIDAGPFKFVNFSHFQTHVNTHGDQTGRIFDYDDSWFLPRTDIDSTIVEKSIVRMNLFNKPNYAPYCGNGSCFKRAPFDANFKQFRCASCNWLSDFPYGVILKYGQVWAMPWALEQDN